MSGFHLTVIIIALIILVLCLIFIGIALEKHNSKDAFPPVLANCPDYWTANSDGGCAPSSSAPPTDCQKLNSDTLKSMNLCDKSRWAKGCKITWDGVTNNDRACSKHNR